MAYAPDARSLGELFGDLTRETGALVRAEFALARAEIGAKAARAGRHAGLLAAGGILALTGLFTLAAGAVLVLVEAGVPPWGAALLVGLGLSATGALLAVRGLTALRDEDLTPSKTLQSLKETAAWTRQTR